MRRRRIFFGETAAEVKEYFEVSAYRNILDMLNTLETVLESAANYLFNRSYVLREAKGGSQVGDSVKGAIGYAIKQMPEVKRGNRKYDYAAYYYAVKQLKKYIGFAPSWADDSMPQKKPSKFDSEDMLNLARQVEWEMNRVRLPMPHNFRQLASWMTKHGNFKFAISQTQGRTGKRTLTGGDKAVINYFEMIRIIGDELTAVREMRKEVRKEIDAAELAAKVQENTLRSEQDDLISREQAEKEAQQREADIRAEKALAYRKDYDTLIKKIKEAVSRADQLIYLEQLRTVVDAINALVADSEGRVRVPEIDLLPPPSVINQVEQAVAQETEQAAQEVIQEAQQEAAVLQQQAAVEEKAVLQLMEQAKAQTDPAAVKVLESEINRRSVVLDSLEFERSNLEQTIQTAQSVQQSVKAGDMTAARDELRAAESKAGGGAGKIILAALGLWLMS